MTPKVDGGTAAKFFYDVTAAFDVPRHEERRYAAALKRWCRKASRQQLVDFQASFDAAVAAVRTPALWSAATLLHDCYDPHEYDAFATWLVLHGRHSVRQVGRDPDTALEAFTRRGKRRAHAHFDAPIDVAWSIYGQRFDADLFEIVTPPQRATLVPLLSDIDDDDQRWPHPSVLQDMFPKLWDAFACDKLHLFPWIDDPGDVCSCCGRVHRYGYGFFASGGECVGNYTLHWVEGEFDSFDSVVRLDDDEEHHDDISVALRHRQWGNDAGCAYLPKDQSPVEPATSRLLDPDEARTHRYAEFIGELANATLFRESRTRPFRLAWGRRREFGPIHAAALQRPPSEGGRLCDTCGVVHENVEVSHRLPDEVVQIDDWQKRHRIETNYDELTLDGRRRFARALIPVAVAGSGDTFHLGSWVERLDPSRGTAELDATSKQDRLRRGARGLVANDLLFLPHSTLGVDVEIRPGPAGEAPRLFDASPSDHPIAELQRDGMAADMPRRLLSTTGH